MKQYYVFAGEDSSKGMEDFKGAFEILTEAYNFARNLSNPWKQIYDMQNALVLWEEPSEEELEVINPEKEQELFNKWREHSHLGRKINVKSTEQIIGYRFNDSNKQIALMANTIEPQIYYGELTQRELYKKSGCIIWVEIQDVCLQDTCLIPLKARYIIPS